MIRSELPVSWRQIAYLALTVFVPLIFAAVVIVWAPPKPGSAGSSKMLAAVVVGGIAAGLVGIVATTARRRVIEIGEEALVVRHSLYTLVLKRSEVRSMTIREVKSVGELGLSTRKNGIAAFGYLSGWFWGPHGDLTFCAVSSRPVYMIAIEGDTKCKHLALSGTAELASTLAAWPAGASRG